MDKNCAIARDLMPQVIDNVASLESKAFVEEHIAGCEPCTQVYADMENEIITAEGGVSANAAIPFKTAVSQLKKTLGWKRIRVTTIAVLITAAVFVIGFTGYYFFCVDSDHPMSNADYTIRLLQTDHGTVYMTPQFLKDHRPQGYSSTFSPDSGVMYVHCKAPIIPSRGDQPPMWTFYSSRDLLLTDDNILTTEAGVAVREIRQGTENDYVVVYQAGDTIESMSPSLNTYFNNRELYQAQMDEANDAMDEAQRLDFEAYIQYQDFLLEWENALKEQLMESPEP